MKRYFLLVLLLVVAALSATPVSAQTAPAYWPTAGWQTATPEEQGMKSDELANYFTTWSQDQFRLDSLLVVRNGYLVAEAYTPLNDATRPHNLYSATKSVTGALIGVLLQEGLLPDLDTPVLSLFPNRTFANVDARKEAMTVHDLLTMSSGLDTNDMTADSLGVPATSDLLEQSDDWLQFALDLPMTADPGTQWYYNNVGPYILSAVISELTGKSASDYAAETLFAPLGITDYRWMESPEGVSLGASELYLTPRDMAKIGYLYLNEGMWDGQQIVPADFAAAAIGNQIATPWDGTTYGYLWWRIEPINLSFALGYGGQYIMVLPSSNMVVVATGGMTEDLRVPLNGYPMFFSTAGLSAADSALPANPDGVSQLAAVTDTIHTPAAVDVPPLPETATVVSGQPYYLFKPDLLTSSRFVQRFLHLHHESDAWMVQTLTLTFDESDQAMLNLGFVDGGTEVLPIGLDGIYRESESRMGLVGVKGEWLTPDLFRVYIKHPGTALLNRLDINFIPQAMNIMSFEYTSGIASAVLGYAMQAQQ